MIRSCIHTIKPSVWSNSLKNKNGKLSICRFHNKSESWIDTLFNMPKGFGKFERSGKSSPSSDSTGTDKAGKSTNPGETKGPTTAGSTHKSGGSSSNSFKGSSKGSGGSGGPKKPEFDSSIVIGVSAVLAALGATYLAGDIRSGREISWQEFQTQLLEKGAVDKIAVINKSYARVYLREKAPAAQLGENEFRGGYDGMAVDPDSGNNVTADISTDKKFGRYPNSLGSPLPRESPFYFNIGNVDSFERKLEEAQTALNIKSRDFVPVMYISESSWMKVIEKSLPELIVLGVMLFVVRRAMSSMTGPGGAGGGIFSMNKSPAKRITKEMVNTTFADVAGAKEAKKEIMEFVEFLKNSKKFTDLGAKIPRGALLSGPPGTGKTLLARATAGEANVPFFAVSGSDFVEMFVGMGASRVRELFKEARANAPCIIFIDEIDAVGRKRGNGRSSGGNDERESTLNQLLVEMDGFDTNSSVIVLAGTNRVDVLDNALIRPGRFDRQILVDKPDIESRKEIFNVHLRKIVVDGDKEKFASRMASLTPGFAGADIANICNEAAIVAARLNKKAVEMVDFEAATDRVIGGSESHRIISPEQKKVVAYHEAGHAVAGWFLEHADPLLKVTIIPRSSGALGFAQYLPRDITLRTKDEILDVVCMALAGRAAEQINFGKVTTGASDDLRRVTSIVYQMVQVYGMNEKIGQVAFPREDGAMQERVYSEATAELMDQEVKFIVDEAYARTLELMKEKQEQVRLVAEMLLEKETITNLDVAKIIGKRPHSAGKEYTSFVDGDWDEKAVSPEASNPDAAATSDEEKPASPSDIHLSPA